MDAYERILAARGPRSPTRGTPSRGIYESNYLKANAPDGSRALWIKHNALIPVEGTGLGEFWAVAFERGAAPIVVKREVAWSEVEAAPDAVHLRAGDILLEPTRATGRIGSLSWDLRLRGVQPALYHLPWASLYTGGFPKKKLLTPAPNLRFDGELVVRGERWDVDGWVGLRGHNWGSSTPTATPTARSTSGTTAPTAPSTASAPASCCAAGRAPGSPRWSGGTPTSARTGCGTGSASAAWRSIGGRRAGTGPGRGSRAR
ncbi:MAG: hypothetical protein R3F59_26195 [Myxococcota bacterium]